MLRYRPMRARAVEASLVGAVALLLTVVMTWPIAPRMLSAGRTDSGDGRYSVWNVAWVAYALVTDPLHVYDANIFFPHRRTLTYSEPNIGAGAIAIPFYWLSGKNPHFAHNAVLLLSFVLAMAGVYALVAHLSGARAGAAVAAVSFAFCPFIFSHLTHIQLLMTAGIPLALLAMHRYVATPSAGRAITLGLVLAAQALSCGYYGIYAGLLVGYGFLFYGVSRSLWRSPRYWMGVASAALVAVAIVAPFFLPYVYLNRETGFERSIEDARRWAADWHSYVVSSAWGHTWVLPYVRPWSEVLYPGTAAIVLGLLGLGGLRRRNAPPAGRGHIVFYASVVAIAFWASFGPDAGLYRWLYDAIPVFPWLRAPARFGLVCVLGLAVLGGFAVAGWVSRARRPVLVGAVLVLVTLTDLWTGPLELTEPRPVDPAHTALASLPKGPVAEFPFFHLREDFHRHTEFMLFSTAHWQPLVNGYSDNIPMDFRELAPQMDRFPDARSFAAMRARGVRYLLVHMDYYGDGVEMKRNLSRYAEYLRPRYAKDPVWLYEIVSWP
jgi:hypothetical protein